MLSSSCHSKSESEKFSRVQCFRNLNKHASTFYTETYIESGKHWEKKNNCAPGQTLPGFCSASGFWWSQWPMQQSQSVETHQWMKHEKTNAHAKHGRSNLKTKNWKLCSLDILDAIPPAYEWLLRWLMYSPVLYTFFYVPDANDDWNHAEYKGQEF